MRQREKREVEGKGVESASQPASQPARQTETERSRQREKRDMEREGVESDSQTDRRANRMICRTRLTKKWEKPAFITRL